MRKINLVVYAGLLVVGLVCGLVLTNSTKGTSIIRSICGSTDLPRLICGESFQNLYWRELRGHQMRADLSIKAGAVLFFGDSHVQGLVAANVVPNGVSFGIGGEDSSGLKVRFSSYRSLRTAKSVVIAIGANDHYEHAQQLIENICEILDQSYTPVLISGVLPVDEKFTVWRNNRAIHSLNERLADVCGNGCLFQDASDELTDSDGNLIYHDGDGVHLNALGYQIWENVLRAGLEKLDISSAGPAECRHE